MHAFASAQAGLMIYVTTRSNNSPNTQLFNPFRSRGNFFDDKIPGYRLPGPTAATAF